MTDIDGVYVGSSYCSKCKSSVKFVGIVLVSNSGYRRMAQGDCKQCGTKISRIVKVSKEQLNDN